MLRSKIGEVWRTWVLGKKLMGLDKNWNKYYRWTVVDGGEQAERREVQLFTPIKSMADYDPDAIPIEWRSWLNGHRQIAPTTDEIDRLEAYREKVRENAKRVDAEDEKQRIRGQVLGKQVEGPDIDAFLRQVAEKRDEDGRRPGS
eukprot:jgi/Ulvmu1/5693/UM024_0040.1